VALGGGASKMSCDGADERSRTADLLITNQLLYQLSYVGTLNAARYTRMAPNGAT
jgi:hypothetical protein